MKRVEKKEKTSQIRDDNSSISLPKDLITEILLKLPSKSLVKLIVVSKLWSRIIRSKHFIDKYMNRSLTRPCYLITSYRDRIRFFHSIPQESSYTSTSSIHLSLDHPRLFSLSADKSPPVRGLICCQDLDNKMEVVLNPSTGQILVLPKLKTGRRDISRFFGYDPIKDEYKVLCMTVSPFLYKYGPVMTEEHQVFTFSGGAQKRNKEATWRMIECKLPHFPATNGLCMMNGVIYYGARPNSDRHRQGSLIVGFDVRLEVFTPVKLPDNVEFYGKDSELVNYQGKVAIPSLSNAGKLDMWVLEDVDKQEWSKISAMVPSWLDLGGSSLFSCRGAISSGEFIFAPFFVYGGPFSMISYDRKENIATRVEIEGIGDGLRYVSVFLDHIECPIIL